MIRPLAERDAAATVAVLRESSVDWTGSAANLLHRLGSHPPRARQAAWVAEEDGQVVGAVRARLRWEVSERVVGWIWVGVRPRRRGRGVGSALYAAGERHLLEAGVEAVESFTAEESGERFLAARGFRQVGLEHVSRLDLVGADLSALPALAEVKAAEGFAVVPLARAFDRPRDLHAVYATTLADVPQAHTVDDLRYEEWERESLGDPDLSLEASAVVLHEGRPVALTFVIADGEGGAANDMTGTLPEFRGRGLARLAKLASARWAREQGIEWILTENDDGNPGMRALNASLGYRPAGTQTLWLRELR
ncbi:MAG TPA: GNAT family N-acetyltransferase [Gaiellaceae bacterium]|nr:GNAT family N-acetyltransferase [Gaiellaceae bacterium]